eukprot:226719-Rhodomonas_salina.1
MQAEKDDLQVIQRRVEDFQPHRFKPQRPALQQQLLGRPPRGLLRIPYAMSGTDIGFGAIRPRPLRKTCDPTCMVTATAHHRACMTPLPPCAHATVCSVLIEGLTLSCYASNSCACQLQQLCLCVPTLT